MDKSKSVKRIVIAIVVAVALVVVGFKTLDTFSYHFVRFRAENYLCQKYDAKKSEFELTDYKHSHLWWSDYNIFYLTPKWDDFSFEYKYNDRTFFVNRYEGKFYDDYQLDDIEQWCTEWLQENVDKQICGIYLKTQDILIFNNKLNVGKYELLNKKDTEEIIKIAINRVNSPSIIYFENNDLKYKDKLELKEKHKEKIFAKLNTADISITFASDSFGKKEEKSNHTIWTSSYNDFNIEN